MFTIKITLPGGRIATKQVATEDETLNEVERVYRQLVSDYSGTLGQEDVGVLEAFTPTGDRFLAMAY